MKIKKVLKIIGYFLVGIFSLIIIFLVGLTIFDSIRMNLLESKVTKLKLGDSSEKVIQLLGEPAYTWKKGNPEVTFFGKQAYYENSGMAYGKIMNWKNPFYSNFPYFYPFKFRFFGSDEDDILIYLNEEGRISEIEMPK